MDIISNEGRATRIWIPFTWASAIVVGVRAVRCGDPSVLVLVR